jgi:hypothetical protein
VLGCPLQTTLEELIRALRNIRCACVDPNLCVTTADPTAKPNEKHKKKDILPGVVQAMLDIALRLQASAARQENQDLRGVKLVRQVRHVLLMRSHLVHQLDQPRRMRRTFGTRNRRMCYFIAASATLA